MLRVRREASSAATQEQQSPHRARTNAGVWGCTEWQSSCLAPLARLTLTPRGICAGEIETFAHPEIVTCRPGAARMCDQARARRPGNARMVRMSRMQRRARAWRGDSWGQESSAAQAMPGWSFGRWKASSSAVLREKNYGRAFCRICQATRPKGRKADVSDIARAACPLHSLCTWQRAKPGPRRRKPLLFTLECWKGFWRALLQTAVRCWCSIAGGRVTVPILHPAPPNLAKFRYLLQDCRCTARAIC